MRTHGTFIPPRVRVRIASVRVLCRIVMDAILEHPPLAVLKLLVARSPVSALGSQVVGIDDHKENISELLENLPRSSYTPPLMIFVS